MVLAEGVACWVQFPFFSMMAELTVSGQQINFQPKGG